MLKFHRNKNEEQPARTSDALMGVLNVEGKRLAASFHWGSRSKGMVPRKT
jgi:hypothetical protein